MVQMSHTQNPSNTVFKWYLFLNTAINQDLSSHAWAQTWLNIPNLFWLISDDLIYIFKCDAKTMLSSDNSKVISIQGPHNTFSHTFRVIHSFHVITIYLVAVRKFYWCFIRYWVTFLFPILNGEWSVKIVKFELKSSVSNTHMYMVTNFLLHLYFWIKWHEWQW